MTEESGYKLFRVGAVMALGAALTTMLHHIRHRQQQ